MKKIILAFIVAGSLIACNNASDSTQDATDSLDSIATEKKEVIDSTAEQKKEIIDSTTEAKKEAVEGADTVRNNDNK